MRIGLSLLLILTLGLVTTAPLAASPATEGQLIQLTGRQIPRYYLVLTFYENALMRYQLDERVFYHQFVERMGLKVGSEEEDAFARSIEAFAALLPSEAEKAVRERELTLLREDPVALKARRTQFRKGEAGALGDIYHRLKSDLAEFGSTTDGIDNMIEGEIAQQTNMTSDKPLDADFFAIVGEFERRATKETSTTLGEQP